MIVYDDVTVVFDECESYEENEVGGAYMLRCPDCFPDLEHVVIDQLWKNSTANTKASRQKCWDMINILINVDKCPVHNEKQK